MEGRALKKRKSLPSLNYNVYARPFIHCLYFICARKNYVTVEIHPKRLKCCSRNGDDLSCLKPFLLFIARCERRVSNRPFPHYVQVSKHKELRTRVGWTISYKSLYFVHPSLELVPLFTGMRGKVYCTKSLFVGHYNFANRRGLGRVKEGFRFFSSFVSP